MTTLMLEKSEMPCRIHPLMQNTNDVNTGGFLDEKNDMAAYCIAPISFSDLVAPASKIWRLGNTLERMANHCYIDLSLMFAPTFIREIPN